MSQAVTLECGHDARCLRDGACVCCRLRSIVTRSTSTSHLKGATICRHLGEDTGAVIVCLGCGDRRTELKVYSCALHGHCLPWNGGYGLPFCGTCKDRRAPGPAEVAPSAGQGVSG